MAWRYLYNFKPAIAWRLDGRPSFSGEAARVVRDLREDGIAVTSVRALLGADEAFDELASATRKLELEKAPNIAEARRIAQAPARSSHLWHRDWDDLHHILNVFVHLTDVDDGCGPFTYARGSHRIDAEPGYLYREGVTTRSDDAPPAG